MGLYHISLGSKVLELLPLQLALHSISGLPFGIRSRVSGVGLQSAFVRCFWLS